MHLILQLSIFIKNKATEGFTDILGVLGLEDIPPYGKKDKRKRAYLHTKK